MTFRKFAFNNVFRNKRLYAAYFLSSMFTVMVFFTFAIFSFHPALNGEAMNNKVTFGLGVAGGIIYVFSFFFILYSMSSFLQSRKKEFGILMVQGMSTRQIRLMVFLENMLIGFFATIGGIGLGLVFAKIILLIAEEVLVLNEALNFYFPIIAIVVTFLSFILLFIFISLFVTFVLRTKKLIELIKADAKPKETPKTSTVLTLLAILLLGSGYAVALTVKGVQVFYALLPVVTVVIIGTYLLFTQLSVYFIGKLKKREKVFWSKTNMLLFSDLAFRMKDNARAFFMVAVISTVAFSAIGSLFGTYALVTDGVKASNPYTFVYSVDYKKSEEELESEIEHIEQTLSDHDVKAIKDEMQLHYFDDPNSDSNVLIVKQSEFNRFAKLIGEETVQIDDQHAFVVSQSNVNMMNTGRENRLMDTPLTLQSGSKVEPVNKIDSPVMQTMEAYYIVNDAVFKQLPASIVQEDYYIWQSEDGQKDAIIEAAKALANESKVQQAVSVDYTIHQIIQIYSPILFVGLFIGIVFFVSAGSFLYFRLYTDLDGDKEKFKAIAKIGLTDSELKKIITRQTAILFFTPIIVAIIHGAVALTALSRMFNYNLVKEATLVLSSFFVIQVIYFLVVRYFYTKQIKTALK